MFSTNIPATPGRPGGQRIGARGGHLEIFAPNSNVRDTGSSRLGSTLATLARKSYAAAERLPCCNPASERQEMGGSSGDAKSNTPSNTLRALVQDGTPASAEFPHCCRPSSAARHAAGLFTAAVSRCTRIHSAEVPKDVSEAGLYGVPHGRRSLKRRWRQEEA